MALTAVEVLAKFADFLASFEEFQEAGGFQELHKKPATKGKASTKPEPVDDDVDENDETGIPSAEDAAKMPVTELRKLAVELGLEEQKVKAGILAELDEMRDEESDDEDEEDFEDDDEAVEDDVEDDEGDDEEDDDEDSDEEDEPYTREELEEMSLKELRATAKSEGVKVTEYRNADKDKLVELILGLDAPEEPEDDEEDEDEEVVEIDEASVRKMNPTQLMKLAEELEIAVPRRVKAEKDMKKKKEALVNLIMDSAEDDDEDDE